MATESSVAHIHIAAQAVLDRGVRMKVALSISINMFIFGAIVVWICSSKLIQIDYVSTEVVIYLTSLITIGSLFIIASLVCGVIISLAYRKE